MRYRQAFTAGIRSSPLRMTEFFCAPSHPVNLGLAAAIVSKLRLSIHVPAIEHLHFVLVRLNNLRAMEFAVPQKGKTA
jgi:hypothetical protein